MRIKQILCILALAVVSLAACGRGGDDYDNGYNEETIVSGNVQGSVGTGTGEVQADPDPNVRTLSVLAWSGYEAIFTTIANRINWDWRDTPYTLNLEITTVGDNTSPFMVNPGEATQVEERLRVMMLAGQGYDIVALNQLNLPWWNWAESGFLLDVWDLIDACDVFHRDNLYLNALEAFETTGGHLFALPFTFGFEYVGINTKLPQSIIDAFRQHDSISKSELLQLYSNLIDNFDYNHLQFIGTFSMAADYRNVLLREIASLIDFENQTSNINSSQFVDFLNLVSIAYPIDKTFNNARVGGYPFIAGPEYELLSNLIAFHVVDNHLNAARGVLPAGDEALFNYFIPLSDNAGNLRTFNGDPSFAHWDRLIRLSFPAMGNEDLAWYFTLHLFERYEHDSTWGRESFFSTPIVRSNFASDVGYSLERAILFDDRRGAASRILSNAVHHPNTQEQEIENAIARLAELNEMPIAPIPFFPQGLSDGLMDTFDQFLRGLITAQAAAEQMHNRVFLWLIE